MTPLFIILAVIAVVLAWVATAYNRFVTLGTRTDESWSDIEVQLKRRYDLIPNLVETVKGYATHEKETLADVTEMRTKATSMHIDPKNVTPEQIAEFSKVQDGLSGALGRLLAVSENYPDLKANQNFIELQRELTDTENKIQAARRFFNTNVRDLNIAVDSFPSNLIANMFGFAKRVFFELAESEQAAKDPVKVQF
jgi:LemA protein